MARIVRIHETGGPEVLRVEDIPVRAPGPGEIRIHVEAMGINRSDVIFRYGHHPVKPQFPSLIGSEAAGTVEAIGEGVQGFSVGEAVSVIPRKIGRASCRERVCQYVLISVVAGSLKKKLQDITVMIIVIYL